MIITFYTANGAASQPRFWPQYWKTVSLGFNPDHQPEYGVLMKHLSPGQSVLDIGCGRGVLVRELLPKGYKARGIDFDADSILDSVAQAGYFPAEIGDLNQLPYVDNSFDAILVAGTIEHVFEGPQRGFSEVYRVLRPGGVVVLTIPYINLVRKVLLPFYLARDVVFSYFPERKRKLFFEYVFTRSEVVALLSRAGFSVCEWERSYYTTTLRKIPGVIGLSELIFGKSRNGAAARRSSATKRALKRTIEGILNMIIPNRLVVVTRKPA
ncbi:MAG TPA: methyltransferase domain-containing protein [Terriglobales bacterium]|nr:methyltransferase domain-containing protein [Terriglobales bacterium]